jgi:hypothetical protein
MALWGLDLVFCLSLAWGSADASAWTGCMMINQSSRDAPEARRKVRLVRPNRRLLAVCVEL